jgi:small subunit ribosomal protein S18
MPSSRKQRSRPRPTDSKSRIRRGRPKVCMLCKDRVTHVDYKDSSLLRRFMSERGKIKSRSSTGTCTQHQAAVALAIKNAREMALLPYVVRTLAGDKGGRRGRGGPGGGRPDRPDGPRPDGPRADRAAPTAESAENTEGLSASTEASSPESDAPGVEDDAAVGAVDAAIAEPVS